MGSYGGQGGMGRPSFGQRMGQPQQYSVGQSGIPPWAMQNQAGSQYNTASMMDGGMPRTGGNNVVTSPQMPSFAAPQATGGNMVQPDMGNPFASQAPQAPQAPMQPQVAMADQTNPASVNPQSLLRPSAAFGYDASQPAQAAQSGGASLQSLFPGLTSQQLAAINRIGQNPVGGGAALNDFLTSIRYPGALQPGQTTIR